MQRFRLVWVKHFLIAIGALVLFVVASEVGLRVQHSFQMQSLAEQTEQAKLLQPSWKCHHTLKPLKATVRRNPDTSLPISIRTNSLGLRGDAVIVPKPADVYRIVYLGDETVFASEVAEDESFCKLIEQSLPQSPGRRWEVINAGLPKYCPLLSYLLFKHSLTSLQPDLLILNLDMSDVADDYHYRRHARMGSGACL